VTGVQSLADMKDCELVIEAAPEIPRLKHKMFAELAGIVAPDCVLAANTSSLPITAIAAEVPGPERVVGMHFFSGAADGAG
jgi:3-hydroxybutyryl-CoA dehydrogenase